MSDFSNSAFFLVEHPELSNIIYTGENKPTNWEKYDKDKKLAYSYLDALLGLLERVWIACTEIRLSDEDWKQWRRWTKDLTTNSLFLDVFNDNKELYDSSFINEVQNIINKVAKA